MIDTKRRALALATCLVVLIVAAACTTDDATPTLTAEPTATANGTIERTPRPTPTVSAPVPTTAPAVGIAPDTWSTSGKPVLSIAEYGGTLTAAVWQPDVQFNTWEESEGASFITMHPLHNLLLQPRTWGSIDDFQERRFLELHPDLAVSWQVEPDGLAVTFNLRDDVEWTDGTPLTCADVAWSYNSIRTGRGLTRSPRSSYLSALGEVACDDDYTVRFALRAPQTSIIDALVLPHNIIRPQHIYDGNAGAMSAEPPSVTTGPFVLEDHVPGERITYSRNTTYWDKPFPFLSGVEFVFLADSAVATALQTGAIDVGRPAGYTDDEGEMLERECPSCQVWPRILGMGHTHHIILNHDRRPWDNSELREAFALAIDNTKYIRNIHGGWHFPPTGCGTYPFSPWAMGVERCASIPGYADFFTDSSPAADKARAREILAELGFSPGELPASILFSEDTEQDVIAIISDLQEVGFNATPSALSERDFNSRIAAGDFEAAVHSEWVISDSLDLMLYGHFKSGGIENFGRYSSPEFDAIVDEMRQTTDPALHRALAWDALEFALDDQAKIIISHTVHVPVFGARVRGIMPGLDYQANKGPQLRFDHAWLDR